MALELNSGLLMYVNSKSHLSSLRKLDFRGLFIFPVQFYAKESTSSYRQTLPPLNVDNKQFSSPQVV